MKSIISTTLSRLIYFLPKFIQQKIWPPAKVASNVKITLRHNVPIVISLGKAIPDINIYFDITNHTDIDLKLVRLLINVWIGQPTVNGTIYTPQKIIRHQTQHNLHFKEQLTTNQVKSIREQMDNRGIIETITIYYSAYFESKIGDVYDEKYMEQRNVVVNG